MMRQADVPGNVDQPTDVRIQASLDVDLLALDTTTYYQLSIKVFKGRVLLCGHVPTAELQAKIGEIAKNTKGVLEVYNKTTLGTSRDASDYFSDCWIATSIAAKIMATSELLPDHYAVDVVDGEVFLLGQAKSKEERDVAIALVTPLRGVKKVYAFIEIKPDTEEQPATDVKAQ